MPRERESELRHLGGKTLSQMHSNCDKKVHAFHQKGAPEFDVLQDLKDLSNKADQLAEKKASEDIGLEEWFDALKNAMLNIRDCKNIKDVEYPPSIETFIITKDKDEKVQSPPAEQTPALKLTTLAAKEATPFKVIASSASKTATPITKEITPDNKTGTTSNTNMVTPTTSVRKKINPFVFLHQVTNPNLKENSLKHNQFKPQTAVHTPVLNRTFDKMNSTVILDALTTTDSNQKSILASICDDSSMKVRSGSKNNLKDNLDLKKKENECPNSHGMLTRSGSKRKSSGSKNKSSKKQKIDSVSISSATLSKTAQPRHPLRDLKTSVLASENKAKLSAVIKPTLQQKQPVVSKEQQILEEIKKKEKKIEENRQKLMAERQLKAEQTKKTREEKRTKTLQKRLQMEKQKEEKREMETKKSQVKTNKENPKKTTRAKELVEQHVKESKSSTMISSTTQSTSNVTMTLPKTPVNRKSDDIESYDLTPLPDSSTYNFSDDEEERPSNKRIPKWAQGVQLKSALMLQYYEPVDTDELFGRVIDPPNLVEIFKVSKKRYLKRTSSAIWNSPPDRSYYH